MTDKTREAIKADVTIYKWIMEHLDSLPHEGGYPVDWRSTLAHHISDRIASLITAQADGVTDEDIEAEALSYASKPLAPYLRSEVFADGARWGISKLAAPKTDGWVSVDERLPESGVPVLSFVTINDKSHMLININTNGHWQVVSTRMNVTHWQPLPAPPKTTE